MKSNTTKTKRFQTRTYNRVKQLVEIGLSLGEIQQSMQGWAETEDEIRRIYYVAQDEINS